MSDGTAGYHIECSRVQHGKYRMLVYSEAGKELTIELELAGFLKGFDWIAGEELVSTWTEPSGEAIPVDQSELIRERILRWGKANHLRIAFQPPLPAHYQEVELRRMGYIARTNADGTVTWSPPESVWRRLWSLFRNVGP